MNVPNWSELLRRAKEDSVTRAEIASVVGALSSGRGGGDAYTLLHILGVAKRTEHRPLVRSFLDERGDPEVAGMALDVLFSHWGAVSAAEVLRLRDFLAGVPWDRDGDLRLKATSLAGEYLRVTNDRPLLRLLVDIWNRPTEDPILRQAAYSACARAVGIPWRSIPAASRQMDFKRDVDPAVVAQVSVRLRA
jgi:hypothetical protein